MVGAFSCCGMCGVAQSHAPGRGKARKFCGPACEAIAREQRRALRPACQADECSKPATRSGGTRCEAHFYRERRNGTLTVTMGRKAGTLVHTQGYLLVPAEGHPRALGRYRAYEHRKVFTDAHGEGPFRCHWCKEPISWDGMHVDHLNEQVDDNRPENLAASCPGCNMHRNRERLMQRWRRAKGLTVNGETLTINEWAQRAGISRMALVDRLARGWAPERAVSEPRGRAGPQPKARP